MARRIGTALVPLGVVAVLAVGCSEPEAQPSGDDAGEGDAGDREVTGMVAPADLPEPPRVRGAQGAVADVRTGTCDTAEGEQEVTGSVTSSTDRATDYVITLSWITDASDVRGRGIAVVRDLAPGETAEWELSAQVADGATTCVPNVVRGAVADR